MPKYGKTSGSTGIAALFVVTGSLVYPFWAWQLWLAFFMALFAHGTVGSCFAAVAPHELGHGNTRSGNHCQRAMVSSVNAPTSSNTNAVGSGTWWTLIAS